MTAVTLSAVTVRYATAAALDGVSLTIAAGERVAVVGPSGAGKSTLLGVIGGTVAPTAGRVEVLGEDPAAMRGRELRRLRARVGTVHQQLHLVGPMRVVHNVNAGRLADWSLPRALWSLVKPQEVAAVRSALTRVGLADRIGDRTDTLSGGQQQRVALARLLVQDPEVVLGDEPVSALDPVLASDVFALLTALVRERGRTLVVSVHDLALARQHCDRVIGLRAGRVAFDASVAELDRVGTAELYATP